MLAVGQTSDLAEAIALSTSEMSVSVRNTSDVSRWEQTCVVGILPAPPSRRAAGSMCCSSAFRSGRGKTVNGVVIPSVSVAAAEGQTALHGYAMGFG